jgi:hypothetical protein
MFRVVNIMLLFPFNKDLCLHLRDLLFVNMVLELRLLNEKVERDLELESL